VYRYRGTVAVQAGLMVFSMAGRLRRRPFKAPLLQVSSGLLVHVGMSHTGTLIGRADFFFRQPVINFIFSVGLSAKDFPTVASPQYAGYA
jgi:hypothetical protein